LKLGLQIGRRLLTETHLDQSNYLANEKQRAASKYNLTGFIRLFQGSSRCEFFRVIAAFSGSPGFDFLQLIQDSASHPRFPVQGHILSAGGDALTLHALLCSTAAALTIKKCTGGV
jgi:hypothetical protein